MVFKLKTLTDGRLLSALQSGALRRGALIQRFPSSHTHPLIAFDHSSLYIQKQLSRALILITSIASTILFFIQWKPMWDWVESEYKLDTVNWSPIQYTNKQKDNLKSDTFPHNPRRGQFRPGALIWGRWIECTCSLNNLILRIGCICQETQTLGGHLGQRNCLVTFAIWHLCGCNNLGEPNSQNISHGNGAARKRLCCKSVKIWWDLQFVTGYPRRFFCGWLD